MKLEAVAFLCLILCLKHCMSKNNESSKFENDFKFTNLLKKRFFGGLGKTIVGSVASAVVEHAYVNQKPYRSKRRRRKTNYQYEDADYDEQEAERYSEDN